jgi:hypothetical protein
MKNPWLLSLAPLLLAVSSSLPLSAAVRPVSLGFPAAGQSPVECIGDGVYAANSTYQANLRRLAALLTAEVSDTPGESYTARAVGYWPNRLLASSFCWRRYKDGAGFGYPCADCIARAFLEVERACPYRREASFSDGNCTLELEESRIFGPGGILGEFCYASSTKNLAGFSFHSFASRKHSLSFAMSPINLWQLSGPGLKFGNLYRHTIA